MAVALSGARCFGWPLALLAALATQVPWPAFGDGAARPRAAERYPLEWTSRATVLGKGVQLDALQSARRQPPAFSGPISFAADGTHRRQSPPFEHLQEQVRKAGGIHFRENLSNVFDSIYIAIAEVGTPGRNLRLIVDTGSSDLWVAQEDIKNSTTKFVVPDSATTLLYGKGEVTGNEIKDRLCLQSLCVESQVMIAGSNISDIGPRVFDGLLGLGFPGLSEEEDPSATFLARLSKGVPWDRPSFGLALRHGGDPKNSFITFGEFEAVVAEAPAGVEPGVVLPVKGMPTGAWVVTPTGLAPVVEATFWLVQFEVNISVPLFGAVLFQKYFAMLDSGTSFITVPSMEFDLVMKSVIPPQVAMMCSPLAGQIVCPCGTPLNSLTLKFTGGDGVPLTIVLSAEDLMQQVGEGVYPDGTVFPLCRVALQSSPPQNPFWILGDVFYRKLYVVHDVSREQVVLFKHRDGSSEAAGTAIGKGLTEDQPKALFDAMPMRVLACVIGVAVLLALVAVAGGRGWRRRATAREVRSAGGLVGDEASGSGDASAYRSLPGEA